MCFARLFKPLPFILLKQRDFILQCDSFSQLYMLMSWCSPEKERVWKSTRTTTLRGVFSGVAVHCVSHLGLASSCSATYIQELERARGEESSVACVLRVSCSARTGRPRNKKKERERKNWK